MPPKRSIGSHRPVIILGTAQETKPLLEDEPVVHQPVKLEEPVVQLPTKLEELVVQQPVKLEEPVVQQPEPSLVIEKTPSPKSETPPDDSWNIVESNQNESFTVAMQKMIAEDAVKSDEERLKQIQEAECKLIELQKTVNTISPMHEIALIFLLMIGDTVGFNTLITEELKTNPGLIKDPRMVETVISLFDKQFYGIMSFKLSIPGFDSNKLNDANVDALVNEFIFKIAKTLLDYKFATGNALNTILKKFGRYQVVIDNKTEMPYIEQLDNAEGFIDDLIGLLIKNSDVNSLSPEILRDISLYRTNIVTSLVNHGLDISRVIDGYSVGYWLMRCATKPVYVTVPFHGIASYNNEINQVGYKAYLILKNSIGFQKNSTEYYIGCENLSVFTDLVKVPEFNNAMKLPIPGINKFLIETIKSESISRLLSAHGCPKSDLTPWSPEIANNLLLAELVIAGRIVDNGTHDFSPLFGVILKGNFDKENLSVVNYIISIQGKPGIDKLSYVNQFNWSPLHMAIHRFSLATYIEKKKNVGKNDGNRQQTDLDKFPLQLEILKTLYSKIDVVFDKEGRTPLMCLEYKMPDDEDMKHFYEFLMTFAKLEIFNLKAQKKTVNISEEQYVKRLIEWRRKELAGREREAKIREQHVDAVILKQAFDWVVPS